MIKHDRGQASFSFGLKFQNAILKADRALGAADSAINGYPKRSAEEFLVDAIEAMMTAQQAIGEDASIAWNARKPIIKELQNAIDAIKGEKVDTISAIRIIAKIRNLERF